MSHIVSSERTSRLPACLKQMPQEVSSRAKNKGKEASSYHASHVEAFHSAANAADGLK